MMLGSSAPGRVFDALSDPLRRQLLVGLLTETSEDGVDERDPLAVVSGDQPSESLEIELVHNHLPKLEAMGFIQWDRESCTIRKGRNWGDVAPLLILIRDHRDELPDDWL